MLQCHSAARVRRSSCPPVVLVLVTECEMEQFIGITEVVGCNQKEGGEQV